eukprot:417371_1
MLVNNGTFQLGRKMGKGACGDTYYGSHITTKQQVCMQVESIKRRHPRLLYEYKVYRILNTTLLFTGFENINHIKDKKIINTVFGYIRQISTSNHTINIPTLIYFICIHYYHRPHVHSIGVPKIFYFGREGDFNVMVMELLGPSLEDLLNFCNRKFSLKTILLIADQMLSRIQFIHSKHFIHRDIKPENFLLGLHNKSKYYSIKSEQIKCLDKRDRVFHLISFRLCKRYRNPQTHKHIKYVEGKHLTGTARYASINAHCGCELSRRDDLESLAYILLYFLRGGSLPWQGIKGNTKREKYTKIANKKMTTCIQVLCKGIPQEFAIYFKYCRSLKFDEKPDYKYLRKLFTDLYFKRKYKIDYVYDWSL